MLGIRLFSLVLRKPLVFKKSVVVHDLGMMHLIVLSDYCRQSRRRIRTATFLDGRIPMVLLRRFRGKPQQKMRCKGDTKA